MKIVLIAANPKSGSTDRHGLVMELSHRLSLDGVRSEVIEDLQGLEPRIQTLHSAGDLHTVVAAGGDGTVSAVATRTPTEVPIAVLPLGSENLLAQYFGLSQSPAKCAESIVKQKSIAIDAMEVHGKVALLMSSIGFDADVVRRVHLSRKSHITRWAYRLRTLQAWWAYRWPRFQVTVCHDQDVANSSNRSQYTSQWCFIFNIPRYAAGISILDHCDPSDGLLDIGLFESSGPIKGLLQFWDVMRGRHVHRKDWHHLSGAQVDVQRIDSSQRDASVKTDVGVQFDGDWSAPLPATVRVLRNRIRLVQGCRH